MKTKIEIPYGLENGNVLIYDDFINEYFEGNAERCLDCFRGFIDIIKYGQKIIITNEPKFNYINIKVVLK